MGRKKKHDNEERFISREELVNLRGLSLRYIRESLKAVEYDLGYRTKRYKLSEVDRFMAQKKTG